MKTLLFLNMLLLLSCKKDEVDPDAKFKENYLKATILLSSGDSVIIEATGKDVHMGCEIWTGNYIYGENEYYQSLSLSVLLWSSGCVSKAGTFDLKCTYTTDKRRSYFPVYENNPLINPGEITFTKVNGTYSEGYFSCISIDPFTLDSVLVSGTFKGVSEK